MRHSWTIGDVLSIQLQSGTAAAGTGITATPVGGGDGTYTNPCTLTGSTVQCTVLTVGTNMLAGATNPARLTLANVINPLAAIVAGTTTVAITSGSGSKVLIDSITTVTLPAIVEGALGACSFTQATPSALSTTTAVVSLALRLPAYPGDAVRVELPPSVTILSSTTSVVASTPAAASFDSCNNIEAGFVRWYSSLCCIVFSASLVPTSS